MKKLLIQFIKQKKFSVLSILVFGILASIFSILIPFSYQYLIDEIIMKGTYTKLGTYCLFIVLVFFTYILFDVISNFMIVRAATCLNEHLSLVLYTKIMHLEENDNNYSKGEIITRIMTDISTIVNILSGYVLSSFISLFTYVYIIFVIFNINIVLGLVCLVFTPVFFL